MRKKRFFCSVCLAAAVFCMSAYAVCAEEAAGGDAGETFIQEVGGENESLPPQGGDSGDVSMIVPGDGMAGGDAPEENTEGDGPQTSGGGGTLDLVIEGMSVVADPSGMDYTQQETEPVSIYSSLPPDVNVPGTDYGTSAAMGAAYYYLRETFGFNHAAACGVLSNMCYESNFNPKAVNPDGDSYGLCQWHNERFVSLVNFCLSNNLSYGSVYGQMTYLNYELSGGYRSVWNYLSRVPDTAQGAYDAAACWCWNFEMPSNGDMEARRRGEYARSVLFGTDFSGLEEVSMDILGRKEPFSAEMPVYMDPEKVNAIVSGLQESFMESVEPLYRFADRLVRTEQQMYGRFEDSLNRTGEAPVFSLSEETFDEAFIMDVREVVEEEYERRGREEP